MKSGSVLPVLMSAVALCGVNARAFTLREATEVYKAKFAKSQPSLQESGEYCFLIVEGDIGNIRHGNIRPLVLAGEMRLLERYVGGVGLGYKTPFAPPVMEIFTSRIEFEIPPCKSVTVENTQSSNRFRHVSAYDARPLHVARERARRGEPGRRSVEAWRRDVESLYRKYEKVQASSHLWAKMGASLPVVKAECRPMPCIGIRVNGANVERLVRTWNAEKAEKAECEAALAVLPTFSRAHNRLADIEADSCNYVLSSIEMLYGNVAGELDERKFDARIAAISKKWKNTAWNEFGVLAKRIIACDPDPVNVPIPFWREARRGLGFISFARTEDADAAQDFATARSLFLKGEDLPRVISLLESSIARDPGSGESWRYYASALRTAGRIEDAVVAGHEAVMLGNEDENAAWEVIRCYRLMGLDGLSSANAWWLSVMATESTVRERALKLLSEMYPDVFD